MAQQTGRVALVTGATQGLGLALAHGLARRMTPADTVYLTGRDAGRVTAAAADGAAEGAPGGAAVRGEVFDVGDPAAADRLAGVLRERHGGVDVVVGNAVMRIGPDDDPPAFIDAYTQVNNFGTTRLLRAFAPLVRDGGRLVVVASSLGTLRYLAPALHRRFDGLSDLDAVDEQVAAWRDVVKDGRVRASAWPAFVNIPSKIGQVAAVRTLAATRRDEDLRRGILLAAVCPGMINTPTSAAFWDVGTAPTPDEAAGPVLDVLLDPVRPEHYGELVQAGRVLPWRP